MNLIATAANDAVRRIEAETFRLAFPKARIMLLPGSETGALIAVDDDDLVIGATRTARGQLGLAPGPLADPFPAADLLAARQSDAMA